MSITIATSLRGEIRFCCSHVMDTSPGNTVPDNEACICKECMEKTRDTIIELIISKAAEMEEKKKAGLSTKSRFDLIKE
jgi:hypothetical protein